MSADIFLVILITQKVSLGLNKIAKIRWEFSKSLSELNLLCQWGVSISLEEKQTYDNIHYISQEASHQEDTAIMQRV